MTIPPFTADPQQARPYFRKLRNLGDKIAAQNKLLLQARLAVKSRDVNQSIQFYESALALQQNDEIQHELTASF